MKRTALTFLALAGLAAGSARADHVDVRADVHFNAPVYQAPVRIEHEGYWRDVATNVWIPGHWETHRNFWGRHINVWEPGHYEVRNQRVWVSASNFRGDRDRWEHERR